MLRLSDDDRSTATCHHEHRAALPDGLIVNVDTYDGIGTHLLSPLSQLVHRSVLSLNKHFLVGATAATEKICKCRLDVLESISTNDGLTRHYAEIALDGIAFNVVSCC